MHDVPIILRFHPIQPRLTPTVVPVAGATQSIVPLSYRLICPPLYQGGGHDGEAVVDDALAGGAENLI